MDLYDQCKIAETIVQQVKLIFGENSDEYNRARKVQSYWFEQWSNRSGGALAPLPSALAKKLRAAEREVEKDKILNQ